MIQLPEGVKELLVEGKDIYFQGLAVDNVIFGYHDKDLKVLLQRPQTMDKWTLPGGYIRKTESAESAAARVAEQRTGLKDIYLQQFKVFSEPGRNKDDLVTAETLSQLSGMKIEEDHWLLQPVISIGFYTLTDFTKVEISGSFYMEECRWWDIGTIPLLIHDHNQIVQEALHALRAHLAYYPIGYELLPEKFTLPEIRTLYESILGKQLDDRNFAKKLMTTGVLEKLDETRKIKGHRPPYLYQFNKDVYMAALKEGIQL